MEEKTYSATETAKRLGISGPTLSRRVAAGELNPQPKATGQKKQYRLRFSESEIDRFLKANGADDVRSPFSEEQLDELWRVEKEQSDKIGFDTQNEGVWIGRHINIYLGLVMVKCALLNQRIIQVEKDKLVKQMETQRQIQLKTFANYWRRPVKASDIIKEMERVVVVPDMVKEIIRQDIGSS